MAEYNTWDSFLNATERNINIAFENISNIAVELWQKEVEDKFYNKYNPSEYDRSYQTLESIRVLNISKLPNGQISIEIGYDISKIKTFTYMGLTSGIERQGHNQPEMQQTYIEDGFSGYGVDRDGSHALEYMLKYVNGNDFKVIFAKELRKSGYILK